MRFWTLIKPNLAPTWRQLGLRNPSKTGLKTMLKRNFLKTWFLQPLQCEMLVFASPRGSQNNQRCIQKYSKTTWNTLAFSTSNPPNFDFAPTWLPLGHPKALPRGLQGLLKITLGSILGHLSCKIQFLASQGVPHRLNFLDFGSIFNGFQSWFCSKSCVYSFH